MGEVSRMLRLIYASFYSPVAMPRCSYCFQAMCTGRLVKLLRCTSHAFQVRCFLCYSFCSVQPFLTDQKFVTPLDRRSYCVTGFLKVIGCISVGKVWLYGTA